MKEHLLFQNIKSTLTPRCTFTLLSLRLGHITGGYTTRLRSPKLLRNFAYTENVKRNSKSKNFHNQLEIQNKKEVIHGF